MDTVLLREYMADDLDQVARVSRESWISIGLLRRCQPLAVHQRARRRAD